MVPGRGPSRASLACLHPNCSRLSAHKGLRVTFEMTEKVRENSAMPRTLDVATARRFSVAPMMDWTY